MMPRWESSTSAWEHKRLQTLAAPFGSTQRSWHGLITVDFRRVYNHRHRSWARDICGRLD